MIGGEGFKILKSKIFFKQINTIKQSLLKGEENPIWMTNGGEIKS